MYFHIDGDGRNKGVCFGNLYIYVTSTLSGGIFLNSIESFCDSKLKKSGSKVKNNGSVTFPPILDNIKIKAFRILTRRKV